MTDDLTMKIAVALLSKVVGVGYQARGYMNAGDAYDLAESVAAVVNAHNTVETVEELDELPVGSVILWTWRTGRTLSAERINYDRTAWSEGSRNQFAESLERGTATCVVLYRPTTSGDADV